MTHRDALRNACALVLGLGLGLGLCSCVPQPPDPLKDLGTAMDRMSEQEAEWGTMSISAPQLASPSSDFQFQIKPTADDFYNDAKTQIQGRVSEFQQSINSAGFGANISLDSSYALGALAQLQQFQQAMAQNVLQQSILNQQQSLVNSAAISSYRQQLAAAAQQTDPATQQQMISTAIQTLQKQMITTQPSTPPTPTTLPSAPPASTNLVSRPKDLVSQFASPAVGQAFAQFQQLSANPTAPVISDRDAMISSAGDNAVKAMFHVLGDPKLADAFRSKRVLFGVVNVSVNPGWKTKKNYSADVAMQCSYFDSPARSSVYHWFVHNARIPAKLRLRVALDQGIALPGDLAAKIIITNAFNSLPANRRALCDPWKNHDFADVMPDDLPSDLTDALRSEVKSAPIPPLYEYGGSTSAGPLVAAVAPMTATQNLQLQGSFRNQQEVALQIALQLNLMGQSFAAQAFENYAKNLQQDFATATANVVANSYSTAGMFGFQVGPQLRAVAAARAGLFSGPAEILERQSFPALIVFGFEANDIAPKVKLNEETGRLELMEKQVDLVSANNWVPTDDRLYGDRSRPSESERLQLNYWINKYQDRLDFVNMRTGMRTFVDARVTAFKDRLIGSGSRFSLPHEVIAPPTHPLVEKIEPRTVQFPQTQPVEFLLAGSDLDAVDLTRVSVLNGGKPVNGSVSRAGNAIAVKVQFDDTDSHPPLVFQLGTSGGDTVYTDPSLVTLQGSTIPAIREIAPRNVVLPANSSGLSDVTFIVAGSNLNAHVLDLKNPCPLDPKITLARCIDPTKDVVANGQALFVHLSIKPGAKTFAIRFPLLNPPSNSNTTLYLYTPAIEVSSGPLSVEHNTANLGNRTTDQLVFPPGTTLGTLQALLGAAKATTTTKGGGGDGGGGAVKPADPATKPADPATKPGAPTPPAADGTTPSSAPSPGSTAPTTQSAGVVFNSNIVVATSGSATGNVGAADGSSTPSSKQGTTGGAGDPTTQPAVQPQAGASTTCNTTSK